MMDGVSASELPDSESRERASLRYRKFAGDHRTGRAEVSDQEGEVYNQEDSDSEELIEEELTRSSLHRGNSSLNSGKDMTTFTPSRLMQRFLGIMGLIMVVLVVYNFESIRSYTRAIYHAQKGVQDSEKQQQQQRPGQDQVIIPDDQHRYQGKVQVAGIVQDREKQQAVVQAFKHAWAAYERDAMGYDEYHPLSNTGSNFCRDGGIGYMVIDSLDTMMLMGLEEEYLRAREWIKNELSFDRDENYNLFETTIRVLGGLLSAYHLSKNDPLFLERAIDLADRLLPAFETKSGVPQAMSNLGQRLGIYDRGNGGMVSTAEVTTLQLEFRYLSFISGDWTYWDVSEKVMRIVRNLTMPIGLAPIFMNPQEGEFVHSEIRLGSRGDSFYEYLLKQYIQTNRTEPVYREMYDGTMQAIHEHLIKKSLTKGLTYTVELVPQGRNDPTWKPRPKQDHLVCFLGGSLMLGTKFDGEEGVNVRDWETGRELVETCMATHETETGLSPEIVYFRVDDDGLEDTYKGDWYIKGAYGVSRSGHPMTMAPYDARYILRPETVESLFLAYRLTGDEKYRQYGWNIFQSIEKYCKLSSGGYSSILNVDNPAGKRDDKMETFFLAETLKYLYLLFSGGDIIPLDQYVFNTEAHPLPIFTPPFGRLWVER
ncbi:glycoside hydrolase family 47 protein [Amanita thiersii Skay4041]|uniref:alpha-1,2-Mannosidase n=1 Tax=Amanita thiersii Skay4041 TaxID=703135 RepID=A0A2A9NBE3_9AGAR|nr:glycoside hydrolase family 47 protein [Amanita thiersii Skay4041]